MTFKDWLISERVAETGHAGAGGPEAASKYTGGTFGGSMWDLLYPTSPADYQWASAYPLEHFWLKWKFKRGEEIGRPLHNVDNKEFQQRFFTTLESPTAPDGGDGFWKHKDDKDAPSTKVVKDVDLVWIGDGKTSKDTKPIEGYNFDNPFGAHDMWPWYPDREEYLEKIFGDRATLKWPEVSADFDKPWTKKYESYMAEYGGGATSGMHGGIQGLPGSNINNMPGIKSKISATDKVEEEPDMEESPEKLFGFKKWLDKKRARESGQRDIHKKRQGAPLRVPRVYT